MALNFPNSPQSGDTYIGDNGVIYTYDGVKWAGAGVEPGLVLPVASTTSAGVVRVDGTTITITDGVISANVQGGGGGTDDVLRANVGAYQTFANANAATQTTEINSLRANITAANTAITNLTSNAAIQATLLDTLTGNAATQSQVLDTLTSNAAAQATSLTTLLSNAVAQQTSLIDLVANAATQAQAIANVSGTYGNANVATYLSAFDGNILPAANVTYSLGSETRQWRDLWVSNNTIYIGNTPVRVDGGTLLVNGAPVSASTYGNANVAEYLPTYTGNIAGNIVKNGYTWTFSNTGTTTFPTGVRLSNARGPNTVNFTTDIDKSFQIETQTSTTGRLWSFGTDGNLTLPQNANINFSNGVSILAGITGTYGNTQVAAYLPTYTGNIAGNIVKNGNVWTFGTDGTTTFPTNISINYSGGNVQFPRIIADSGKAFSVQAQGNVGSAALSWTVNPDAAGQYAAVAVTKGGGDNLAKVVLTAQSDSGDAATAKTWVFNQTGTTRFPDGTILAPAGQNITMQSDQNSQLLYQNANIAEAPNVPTNTTFSVQPNFATLVVGYRDGNSAEQDNTWLWNIDGMTLPEGGTITEGGGISGAIRLTPAGGANSNQALVIYPTGNAEGDHLHLTAGGGSTELYLGNDFHYVKLVDGGNIELRAATANLSAQAAWTFDTTGNVDTIQALGIKVPDGVPSNVAVINSTTSFWDQNPLSNLATTGGAGAGLTVTVTQTEGVATAIAIVNPGTGYNNGDLITVTSGTSNATFTIVIAGRNSWRFSTGGNLTLPETGYLRVGTGIVAGFASSPAPVISGFSSISAENFRFQGNGVNILSAVGAGAYGNTQVATYLSNYNGDINFTSSTAIISNVDVITVGAHIQSPAYQFSNGTSIFDGITGTYSNTNVAAYLTTGVTTANLTATGNVVQNSAYYETYANVTNSGGNLTCNFVNGTTFYATLTANVTANFTNVVATSGQATGATLIVDQGATPYSVANLQINGGSVQSVRWAGGVGINVGTASNTDIMSFSLISLDGTNWRVLGQISNYG